jgi:hypothetical protein
MEVDAKEEDPDWVAHRLLENREHKSWLVRS